MSQKFYSRGKLLLTGEYLVLDGTLSLAIPTKFGQSLEVTPAEGEFTTWKAFNKDGETWFESRLSFDGTDFRAEETTADPTQTGLTNKLLEILTEAHKLNPQLFRDQQAYKVVTQLEFDRQWGLGSSSTLINNIAQWFKIDAYQLLEKTFGGSGYDIAAAAAEGPITYELQGNGRNVLNVQFDPPFKDRLFFVYLNQKQNSRSSIAHYRQQPRENIQGAVSKASGLTASIISCDNLSEFNLLLNIHETLISGIINTPKIKTQLFPDFSGSIKSLGGWGGDFILATGGEEEKDYFRKKGYGVILGYEEMVG
ncbi:GHMP kinase [Antarcticibacterium flavum]|uniref:GHMP kinase n=1 Tax=Antarcticibacterium flavum TaxID=2058175 RepID=A0A5B7X3V2_9FLAO|nr:MULTISPECIES: GYDIA family GHMP kinase [Antarcticibacterium]MCM4160994.1 GHMP kinase [Antarcticibacterium sp. W02-3]QCY69283.1 GHMP kinase [Antarcticibacterium flavum]